MERFERNKMGRGNTERIILEDLGRVQQASLSSQVFKVIRTFTDAPAPDYGVASCFISAPDERGARPVAGAKRKGTCIGPGSSAS